MLRKWFMATKAYILLKTNQVVTQLGIERQECPLFGQYRGAST